MERWEIHEASDGSEVVYGLLFLLAVGVGWWATDVPGWVALVIAGVGGLVGLVLITHQKVSADRTGIEVARSTLGIRWRRAYVPRSEVAVIRIAQHDDPGQLVRSDGVARWAWAPEDPSSTWSVFVRTASGREIALSRGIAYGDEARQLASEVVDALGAPAVPVDDAS